MTDSNSRSADHFDPNGENGGAAEDFDTRLIPMIDEMLQAARSQERPDIDAMIAEHPDWEDELRELWATVQVTEDVASFADLEEQSPQTTSALGAALPESVGNYQIIEEIGRGGMGVVYKAHQKGLQRLVALKMINHPELASAEDFERFRQEAASAAQTNVPHIVPIYEVGEHNGLPYFTMKLIDGTTLARRIADGPLPAREAAAVLLPVCRAVAAAHSRNVLHRDLKPSNILIDREGRPYISDFGLAKRLPHGKLGGAEPSGDSDTLTATGAILGTPGYMAPEQAASRRDQVGPATDVYSLGAILYATMTGIAPFHAANPLDTIMMVLEQEPVAARMLNPKADSDLEMIAMRCLQKPIDLRYRSANDLANDLEAFLNNEPISARSSRFSQILSRAFRETHHAGILRHWGLLWIWHSLVLLALCLTTNVFQLLQITSRLPYIGLWVVGLGVWAAFFWSWRRRSGPITFVERQIAHIWGGSMIASSLLFLVEALLDLPVLTLSPVLGLISGMVFLAKAGILSGTFYVQAVALFAIGIVMAVIPRIGWPDVSISLFGLVAAGCFFIPGLKYFRERRSDRARSNPGGGGT